MSLSPVTFSYYDSFGYVLEDVFIPYNEEIPAIDGFESVLLDSLSLSRSNTGLQAFNGLVSHTNRTGFSTGTPRHRASGTPQATGPYIPARFPFLTFRAMTL